MERGTRGATSLLEQENFCVLNVNISPRSDIEWWHLQRSSWAWLLLVMETRRRTTHNTTSAPSAPTHDAHHLQVFPASRRLAEGDFSHALCFQILTLHTTTSTSQPERHHLTMPKVSTVGGGGRPPRKPYYKPPDKGHYNELPSLP